MNKIDLKEFINKYDILYVEDDPDILEKVTKMFLEIFKRVDTAKNGIEGLEQYERYFLENKKYYDIVISDINMPKMDGTELTKKIKAINNRQIIVIISAYNDSQTLQNLINIGITHFVHKPIKFHEIMDVLSNINTKFSRTKQEQNKVDEVIKLNHEFEALLNGYDSLIIASRTDLKGNITYVSEAFEKISGYTKEELIGQNHSIIRHPDMPSKLFKQLWETIGAGKIWKGNVKNLKKNGDYYWARTSIGPYFDKNGNIIGYNSIREDITSSVKAKELHKKVTMLLKHANDGYMLFDKNLKVQNGYSNICLDIFNKDGIDGLDISTLLFYNDEAKLSLFKKGVDKIFNSYEKEKKELFASLLPTDAFVENKYLKVTYKLVDKKNIMVVVHDITEKIKLKSEIEQQSNYQKMIIQIIANINDFLELKKDFEDFFKELYETEISIDLKNDSKQILQKLHTFKGLFHQMQMYNTPDAIHNLETLIIKMVKENQTKHEIHLKEDIKKNFIRDLQIIELMLGKDYFNEQSKHQLNNNMLKKFKYKLKNLINDPVNINFKVQTLISQIDLLSYIDIREAFNKHIDLVKYLSEILDKPMKPLEIQGEKGLKVPPTFKPFFRNLVHVYKNAVDHGIEDLDTRIINDKEEKGKITCKYFYKNRHIHIYIGDDGAGINLEQITKKAVQKNIITQDQADNLSQKEKINLIFEDELSTKDEANEISGRGVGMAALKQSCEKIDGQIQVNNVVGKGVEYYFKIPMVKLLDTYEADHNLEELIALLESVANRVKTFLTSELDIDIIDSRYINQINLKNKINTVIEIKSDVVSSMLSFSFTEQFIRKFSSVYFQYILEDETVFKENIEEISKEIVNTLVGLAIQDFPAKFIDGMLTTPSTISEEDLKNLIEQEHKILAILIQTNYGNLVCKLILEK